MHVSSQKWVAITGVTGFIGGSLAAAFLQKGIGVVAMTRNDPDGARTRKVIDRAIAAEDKSIRVDYTKLLRVIPFDIETLEPAEKNLALSCDEMWHSAAEMSFSPRKLESSYKMNVGGTNALYELMCQGVCKRFYYISTAYTGGTKAGLLSETIHTHPHLVNPYQVTKWSAEMSLATRATFDSTLPVTIYRPSIVIGDTRTGFYPGQPFGLYTFFSAIEVTKAFGAKELMLDVKDDTRAQLVPIQDVVGNAIALSELPEANRPKLEIFHATGIAVENKWLLESLQGDVGISMKFGNPKTTLDHLADCFSKFLSKFFNNAIQFEDQKLRDALGAAYVPTVLTEDQIRVLYAWFRRDFAEKRNISRTVRISSSFALGVVDTFGSEAMQTRVAKKILKMTV